MGPAVVILPRVLTWCRNSTRLNALVDSARNCRILTLRDAEGAEDPHVDVLQAGPVDDVTPSRAVEGSAAGSYW